MSIGLATDGYFGGVGGGSAGPRVTAALPLVGSTIDEDGELVITVESDGAQVDTVDSIEIRLIGSGSFLEIYDGAAFSAPYLGSSVDITAGVATITIAHDTGWIVGVAEVRVTSTDDGAAEGIDAVGSWFFQETVVVDDTPQAIPASATIGTAIDPIDLPTHAINRLPEFLRP